MPIRVTVFMIQFMSVYSESLLAGVFLPGSTAQTLAVGLLPPAFQRTLVGGLTAGATR